MIDINATRLAEQDSRADGTRAELSAEMDDAGYEISKGTIRTSYMESACFANGK